MAPVIVTIAPIETEDGMVMPEVVVEGDDPVRAETSCATFDSYESQVVSGGSLLHV